MSGVNFKSDGTVDILVECPSCGRTIETFRDPQRGLIMYGHRMFLLGRASGYKRPWCPAGGDAVRVEER
jgi:hypothetical protein